MFIEVLYSDLKREKVSFEDIESLPKNNVLFMLVTNTDGINITSGFGFDHYAFCHKKNNGGDWVCINGWDYGEFVWRRLLNANEHGSTEEVAPPLGCMNVVFEGVQVDDETWEAATIIFNEEMI
jgi:hypothetical protein